MSLNLLRYIRQLSEHWADEEGQHPWRGTVNFFEHLSKEEREFFSKHILCRDHAEPYQLAQHYFNMADKYDTLKIWSESLKD